VDSEHPRCDHNQTPRSTLINHTAMTPHNHTCSHSVAGDRMGLLLQDWERVRQHTVRRMGIHSITHNRNYPQQLRWPIINCQQDPQVQSLCVDWIHQTTQELFPNETVYFAAYTTQIYPSGPHIDVGVEGSVRTVLLPLHHAHEQYSTVLFQNHFSSTEQLQQYLQSTLPQYPDNGSALLSLCGTVWPSQAVQHCAIETELWDQFGIIHSWPVTQLHASRPWNPAELYRHSDAREYLIWHTRASDITV